LRVRPELLIEMIMARQYNNTTNKQTYSNKQVDGG
jgi:hypothetical protein